MSLSFFCVIKTNKINKGECFMKQQTLTNQRNINELQTDINNIADEIKVLKNNIRGLQEMIKDHLKIRDYCPHKISL